MDTSGKNIGQKSAAPRPDHYSNEELTSILKFGAANVFKSANENQAKLDELDLDDIINKAEAYETATAPTGTSLGGEEFLNQFAVQDVKADMTSWDDIIPADARDEYEKSARAEKAKQAALEQEERRRAAAAAAAAASSPVKNKKIKEGSPSAASKKNAPARKTDAQRGMELKDRDIRNLIRGIQRFGDLRYRYEAIVKDAHLQNKNRSVIQQTYDEILSACRNAMAEKHAKQEDPNARPKAMLITFRNIHGVNAETVAQRHDELVLLHKQLSNLDDPVKWRFPVENTKATIGWSCDWDVKDDAKLLVGVWKHGHGCWDAIKQDETLGLRNKLFLDEGRSTTGAKGANGDAKKSASPEVGGKDEDKDKSKERHLPNAVHLVRRADYLLRLLYDREEASRRRDSGKVARPKVPAPRHGSESGRASSSEPLHKLPNSKPKPPSKLGPKKPSSGARDTPPPTKRPKQDFKKEESGSDEETAYESMDEGACKDMLRPVKQELKFLKSGVESLPREEKIKELKRCLTAVGGRIDLMSHTERDTQAEREKLRKHLWVWSAHFWPSPVHWTKLQAQ